MKKSAKKWFGRSIRILGLVILIWFVHEGFLKFFIHDFQAWRIEQRLKKDFQKNRAELDDLVNFAKQLKALESFEIGSNDTISFNVYDSLIDRWDEHGLMDSQHIDIGYYPYAEPESIQFLDSSIIVTFPKETIYPKGTKEYNRRWSLNFRGGMDHPLLKPVLAYNDISVHQIKMLVQKLRKLRIERINKTIDSISLRYAGHWGESYNYFIPLSNKVDTSKMNKLEKNYYWYHFDQPLVCGLTDWTKY